MKVEAVREAERDSGRMQGIKAAGCVNSEAQGGSRQQVDALPASPPLATVPNPSKLGAKMRVCGSRHLRTLQPGFIQASFHLKAKFIIDDSTKGFNVSPAAHCFDWQMKIPDQR